MDQEALYIGLGLGFVFGASATLVFITWCHLAMFKRMELIFRVIMQKLESRK